VDIVPSCLDLSAAESELLHEPGREMILKGLVAKAVDETSYDYILIDCPPMLGLLTLNALTVADYLIIPVQVEYLAMRGMAKILQSVQVVQERLNGSTLLYAAMWRWPRRRPIASRSWNTTRAVTGRRTICPSPKKFYPLIDTV
jgi:cellulose biosynthesis protein BcsQ